MSNFSSIEALLTHLKKSQSPALIWYSQPGERIELSGRVFENWVAKTANFLVEELEVEEQPHVSLEMGSHWRSLAIASATFRCGANLLRHDAEDSCAVFTEHPQSTFSALTQVAVDRGPLSARFMGQLPADTLDYCADVRTFADQFYPLAPVAGSAAIFEGLTQNQLMEQVAERAAVLPQLLGKSTHAGILWESPKITQELIIELFALWTHGYAAIVLDPTVKNWDTRLPKICSDEHAQLLTQP